MHCAKNQVILYNIVDKQIGGGGKINKKVENSGTSPDDGL